MSHNHIALLDNAQSREMVQRICEDHKLEFGVFQELIQAELKQAGKLKKRGLWDDFDDILDRITEED